MFPVLRTYWAGLVCAVLVGGACLAAEPPAEVPPELEFLSAGVRLTLVAEHPDVVTPTGIDIDAAGNLWVVVSHTHFRPDNYSGPEHDEIVRLAPDGSRHVFYNATKATMDLELGADGWVYLAERDRVLRVRDSDGDGVGDQEQEIAVLKTEADYPHNGLSGMAWHPSGDFVFALGENFEKQWTLTAPADGRTVTGTGEGGIFRCRPDGADLRRIARGFWNPFGICVRSDGTMFASENDPGSRPPCRLLHVVEGGDYGYQRLYGSAPVHPFVCWNGQLPGTLPMLHSLGEAPCGIAPLGNGLVVTSWTDHRIDFYPLTAAGASFKTHRVTLVRGGHHFRPTCLVQQSPTVFYLTDWVFGSYELHGRGRVWKLEIDPKVADWLGPMELVKLNADFKTAESLRAGNHPFSLPQLFALAKSDDAFIARAAIDALADVSDHFDVAYYGEFNAFDRVTLALAIRKAKPKNTTWARRVLDDDSDDVVFEALRWISDEKLDMFLPDIEQRLQQSTTNYRIFEACLATWNSLSGNPSAGVADAGMLMKRVTDSNAAPITRAYALRLIQPDHKGLKPKLWKELRATNDPALLRELTRTLVMRDDPDAKKMLLEIVQDAKIESATRADAIPGLAGQNIDVLVALAASKDRAMREEALRSLRFMELSRQHRQDLRQIAAAYTDSADLVAAAIDPAAVKPGRPDVADVAAWRKRLASITAPIDLEAGRRIFHHRSVGTCWKCHRHSGRGNVVGPDLSAASNDGDPDRLLVALLQPSKNVDPQYYARTLVTEDGDVFTGIMLRDGGGGKEFYRDTVGRERAILTKDIVTRKELTTSLMPDALIDLMTDREIRDLLAFLEDSQRLTLRAQQEKPHERFLGQWWFDFADGYGGWLSVQESSDGDFDAKLLWRVGSARQVRDAVITDGVLHLTRSRKQEISRCEVKVENDEITIAISGSDAAQDRAVGRRCPPLPPRPDLSQIRFGEFIDLFNGRDLDGWRLQPATAKNGWSVRDGELVNTTPKTDFSAYGAFGNLRSERVFGDCRLHVEFNVDQKCNSGIYIRGLYEAQVVDRDSPMQGIAGPGAVFGRIEPNKNAGLPGGTWQAYDLTLVDRHITVELNGQRVIDNQPVLGCTGGALFGDVTRDGPVYLQGDHTSVRYRNIRISPRINP